MMQGQNVTSALGVAKIHAFSPQKMEKGAQKT